LKERTKDLRVLPSIGMPDARLGVEFFVPLFQRWYEAHELTSDEQRGPVPEVEQGQVRRLHRRTATWVDRAGQPAWSSRCRRIHRFVESGSDANRPGL